MDKKDKTGILEGYKEGEIYNPSEDERELLATLMSRFDETQRNRTSWEWRWEINRLYLKGEQPVRNPITGEVSRLYREEGTRVVSTNNILRPTFRSLLGKLTRTIPTCVVIPPSSDLSDMRGAEIATSLIDFHRRRLRTENLFIDTYRDALTFGTGVLKLSWDRGAGKLCASCPECGHVESDGKEGEECPMCASQADMEHSQKTEAIQAAYASAGEQMPQEMMEREPAPTMESFKEGDIRVEVVDPREFWVDPSATSIEEARWVCHRVALPVSVVRQKFPKKAKYIDSEGGIVTDARIVSTSLNGMGQSAFKTMDDHVYLFEFHERPTDEHPNGRVIWTTSSMVLEEIESPYSALQRLPFYVFYWERNKGEFWGETWLDQSCAIQRELNILLTQLREHRELTNRPKLFVPMGSQISVKEIDTTAGQIIHYSSMGGKPEFGVLPMFPNYVYSEIERLKGDIRTQASVTEQEAGMARSDTSGRYAAIIEAEASQQVGPVLKYNRPEWIELHRGILVLCQLFYTQDRKWTIFGKERPQTFVFDSLNLVPGWDVDIQEDDSLSTNRAIRLQQAMSLLQAGVYTNPQTGIPDMKAFSQMAALKLPGMGPSSSSTDHATAAAIPDLIANGAEFEPKDWDDAEIFAEELMAWLKGNGRNANPRVVEQVNAIFRFYAERTRAAMGQQQAQPPTPGKGPEQQPSGMAVNIPSEDTSSAPDAQQEIRGADANAQAIAMSGQKQES